jgi:MraZ protein
MFVGQFEHTIDEKGRLTIPARYRDSLKEGVIITRGFDQNLIVLTMPIFNQIAQRIDQTSLTDPNARLLKRYIFSNAVDVELDSLGRILIPAFLRSIAQLDTTVKVVGTGSYFEIWSQSLWANQNALMEDAQVNAQRFIAFDLPL